MRVGTRARGILSMCFNLRCHQGKFTSNYMYYQLASRVCTRKTHLAQCGRTKKIRRGPIHWPTRARDEVQIGGCILLRRPAASACVCLGLPSHARCFVLLYPALHARRSAHALLPGSHSTRAGHRDTPSRKRLFNANSIWVTELRQFPGAVVFGRGWRRWRGRRGRRGIFVCCSLQVA